MSFLEKIKPIINKFSFPKNKITVPTSAPSSSKLDKKQRILIIAIIIGALGVGYGFFNQHKNPKTTIKAPVKTQTIASSGVTTNKGNTKKEKPIAKNQGDNKSEKTTPSAVNNVAFANPFIDINVLHNTTAQRPDGLELPSIPNHSVPVPNVGKVPIPNIPSDQQPQVHQGAKPVTVKGVASNGQGKTIAIMSDGTVLSEGSTYKDDRVAYIGGDGVKLENGTHLEYKQ